MSQPAGARKSVQFDLASEVSLGAPPEAPESSRRQHRRGGDTNRGYDGDDSDSSDLLRNRHPQAGPHETQTHQAGPPEAEAGPSTRRGKHRRHRSHDPTSATTRKPRPVSPAGSEDTVDLPVRFDKDGRKKPERDDPLADRFEDILKLASGRLFGNFKEGLRDDKRDDKRRR